MSDIAEVNERAKRHRGPNSQDERLFSEGMLEKLRAAVEEMSWLMTRGYAVTSLIRLVGDRHLLHERQVLAVFRASCSDASLAHRTRTSLPLDALRGRDIAVDGFNVLITIEAALSNGVLLKCRDGCIRDIASVHGSYRSVEETDRALELLAATLMDACPRSVSWYLDSPISNSGRLAARMRDFASARKLPWTVETVFSPDAVLKRCDKTVATADGVILDAVPMWFDFARYVILSHIEDARIVDLAPEVPLPRKC